MEFNYIGGLFYHCCMVCGNQYLFGEICQKCWKKNRKKKFYRLFRQLPYPLSQWAKERLDINHDLSTISSIHDAIVYAFDWDTVSPGCEFWEKVANALNKVQREYLLPEQHKQILIVLEEFNLNGISFLPSEIIVLLYIGEVRTINKLFEINDMALLKLQGMDAKKLSVIRSKIPFVGRI